MDAGMEFCLLLVVRCEVSFENRRIWSRPAAAVRGGKSSL